MLTPANLIAAVYGIREKGPGAGKSFGVKALARHVFRDKLRSLVFNMSQLSSPHELAVAFQRVRDVYLQGNVPFVLFDEFDCIAGGEQLGWLKQFLAPMQDGEFLDGSHVHPIGAAVFVFAGGVASTIGEFQTWRVEPATDEEGEKPDRRPGRTKDKPYSADFVSRKGPDFLSRLRGYVDVQGIEKTDGDHNWMLKRAIIVREGLKTHAPRLFLGEEIPRQAVAPGVLKALLCVPEYRHGVRSIGAIIGMSSLVDRSNFAVADVPADSHLALHVAQEEFVRLLHDMPA